MCRLLARAEYLAYLIKKENCKNVCVRSRRNVYTFNIIKYKKEQTVETRVCDRVQYKKL